jgi:hypothetical protein
MPNVVERALAFTPTSIRRHATTSREVLSSRMAGRMFGMSWVLLAVAAWLVVAAVVGLFAWGLARTASEGDRDQLERLVSACVEVQERAPERFAGPEDRLGGVSSLSPASRGAP